MSLVGTLAKVAIGVAIAKGMQSMSEKSRGGATASRGDGGLFGGPHSPKSTGGAGGGLEDMMGSILGGKARTPTQAQAPSGQGGGLGGILDQLAGGGTGGASGGGAGGLGGLLGGLLGGGAASGGLGDLLGGLAGGNPKSNDRSFGDVLNTSFANGGEPDVQPTDDQNAVAALMLRAMIQATKADGAVDDAEKQKLLGNLGDISPEEMAFVKAEMARKVDVAGLAAQVPHGMQQQVYTMSVMAINLDSQVEAQYLHDLAQALNIDQRSVNAIHEKLGVPALYA